MDTLLQLLEVVRHLDEHLARLSAQMGGWLYTLLFAIVFAETGLVIFPFLPGDSLLFAVGALVAVEGSGLSLPLMTALLLVAAIGGDATNYFIGRAVGPRVFSKEDSWLLNKKHLLKAEAFYRRHGGKAIFLARFAPLLRTFAPFVAGIGRMNLVRFWFFNISGGICWVVGFLLAGYFFGNIPAVKRNFEFVILGIIVVSLLPVVVEWYRSRKEPPASP
ncbi:MAG UNVERIFIED_CONTAM: DedA family protein [Planctomycetaceae bacterium]|jgi:membrane-associated protein